MLFLESLVNFKSSMGIKKTHIPQTRIYWSLPLSDIYLFLELL